MVSLEQTKSCRWRAPFHLRMVLASIATGQKHRSFQARALLEPHSLSSKSRPAPVCGQMVLWSRFLRDPALSAHHLLFPTKHTATKNLSPIHCSPLPSPNTLVFQPVPICCYFLPLVHFSPSILLQPCLTFKVQRAQTFMLVEPTEIMMVCIYLGIFWAWAAVALSRIGC